MKKSAIEMIARCRTHSLGVPRPDLDLTEPERAIITPPASAAIVVAIGVSVPPTDTGVEGHAAFEMPAESTAWHD